MFRQFAVPLTFCAGTLGGLTIVPHPMVGTVLVVGAALFAMAAIRKHVVHVTRGIDWPNGDRDSVRRLESVRPPRPIEARIAPPVLDETVVEFRNLRPITGETPTLPM